VKASLTLVETIIDHLLHDRRVVVHCMGGLGRTGTVVSASLIACGIGPDDAIHHTRVSRPHTVNCAVQVKWLRETFAPAWSECVRVQGVFSGLTRLKPSEPHVQLHRDQSQNSDMKKRKWKTVTVYHC